MKLLIASNNAGKLREFSQILGDLFMEVVTPKMIGLELEVEENGETFAQNALKKAKAFARASGLSAIADDSGLCVDALFGAPGVYSARYAGGHGDDAQNNRLLLDKLEHVPMEKRTARFVASIAFVGEDGTVLTSEASSEGKILFAPEGHNGFGYDPLFYTEVYAKSYAQLTGEQKNAISHRGKALAMMREMLEESYGR
jgi:XTP/dITP diphosphohydrolase